ncbi:MULTISPECIES: hypothetical protein [Stenotrophomonas]|uniref:hypothetical protein n=1 Tax=Stenotrophomonas TaxID=40323 RepID=UPI0015DFB133|nr:MULTISPECIES: hypothetical protein [Stenotrophomonas]MBA0428636.1 hypothetical protein [Stenotrophomonas maltophilia]MDH0274587.1 hypothetical protein [Stenotrophomonas sp. GD04089]MDH1910339.1 hypothetical protein [Stenotrophomonas sp. GD03794]
MPTFPPINPSLYVLELEADEYQRPRQALIRLEFTEGDRPAIKLKVYAQHQHDGWHFIGSFGGKLDCVDGTGPHYSITDGNMYLSELRGLHIGTWCQNQVMLWLQRQPPGRIRSFWLAPADAHEQNQARRNRFYEQFGSQIDWTVPGINGRSQVQPTSDLHALDDVRGVKAIDIGTALAKAYSRIELLELQLSGNRRQFANHDKEVQQASARGTLRCLGGIAFALILGAIVFLKLR